MAILYRVGWIPVLLLTLISTSCSKILDLMIKAAEDANPTFVSIEYDGTYWLEDNPDYINSSQFYLRKHSFSYFIRTYFTDGGLTLKMLVSSGEEFELNKWYSLPSEETDNVWESFALVLYDKNFNDGYWDEDKRQAVAGRVRFTELEQKGNLTYFGQGKCTIKGEFELTLETAEPSGKAIEIKKGQFSIPYPRSNYWDSQAWED